MRSRPNDAQFHRTQPSDPGFRPERLLTLRMLLVPAKYGPDLNARSAVIERMLAGIRGLPQVSAAASIHFLPMNGMGAGSSVYRGDRPTPTPDKMPLAGFSVVSDGYFQTMGTPILAGREFDRRDRMGAPLVAVVNQSRGPNAVSGRRSHRKAVDGFLEWPSASRDRRCRRRLPL